MYILSAFSATFNDLFLFNALFLLLIILFTYKTCTKKYIVRYDCYQNECLIIIMGELTRGTDKHGVFPETRKHGANLLDRARAHEYTVERNSPAVY